MSIPRALVLFTVYFAAGCTNTLSIPLTGLLPADVESGRNFKTAMASDTTHPAARLALLPGIDATLPASSGAMEAEVVALFDQYRDGLLRYVASLGVSVHDGEDVIQEVFLSLYRHLRLRRSRENLRGWVFRVAHNLALRNRQRARRQLAQAAPDTDRWAGQVDPAANPEQQLASKQQQRRLILALAALPEPDQLCLRLRAEGLRYREIADVLDMSLGAVAKSLARSIERLMRVDGR
jgi:RNA polymerase sigma-70 factor (ECF subfamily)